MSASSARFNGTCDWVHHTQEERCRDSKLSDVFLLTISVDGVPGYL